MNLLDLCSGIGAFSIGLERAGFRTVAFCENNSFCRQVLAKHWPQVPCYEEIEKLTAKRIAADGIQVDAICAGWPCQDISNAGKRAGIKGERSGLWQHVARLVRELQPRYVVLENVAALLYRGAGDVFGDLAAFGYDAEWHCIPASAVGAPHIRDRIWIVAYPARDGGRRQRRSGDGSEAHAVRQPGSPRLSFGAWTLAQWSHATTTGTGWWAAEPNVGRMVDGHSAVVDAVGRIPTGTKNKKTAGRRKRLIALGNSLCPIIPEIIGKAIMEFEQCQNAEPAK